MNRFFASYHSVLFFIIFLACSLITFGQGAGDLELLPGTEKMVFDERLGAQRLIGSVNFKYQGNTMYCDSAHFFAKTKEVKAFGKVHINKNDTLNLFCDSLYYNGKTKYAKLWGHVRVRDREYKIITDSMDYDAKRSQAIYRNNARIENILSKEVLTSRIGYFHPNTKNFFFSGNVVYKSDSLKMTTDTLQYNYLKKRVYFFGPTKIISKKATIRCEKGWYHVQTEEGVLRKKAEILTEGKIIRGDSLYHNPLKGVAIGKGNVYYQDSIEPITLSGNYFYKNDSQQKAYVTQKALCRYILKNDTLFLHADTLFSLQDSSKKMRYIKGFRHATFFKNNVQGTCDSLVYDRKADVLHLFHEPIVWAKNAELKSIRMNAYIRDSSLERIDLIEKATAVMEIDSGTFYNQVAGKNMLAYFENDELVKVDVKQNAQTIYFPEETKENDSVFEIKRSGMNRIYASDLRIDLDSGEVRKISYLEKPDAVFYPIQKINKDEQFVKGFSWNPLLRPKSVEELLK